MDAGLSTFIKRVTLRTPSPSADRERGGGGKRWGLARSGEILAAVEVSSDEQAAIQRYLTWTPPRAGVNVVSSFWAVLRDARGVTGRNPDTGRLEWPEHAATWLGAVGYLLFFNQVGGAIRPASAPATQSSEPDILTCLRHFTPLKESEREALYALRCALAHNYSFVNQGRPGLNHVFTLVPGTINDAIVIVADPPWNGDFSTVHRAPRTVVNLLALAELGEMVAQYVVMVGSAGGLAVDPAVGYEELLTRYTFSFWSD
jgi:hypothetical protein